MTLTKAIEILADAAYNKSITFGPDFYNALKLGIEAMKHFKYHRDENIISFVKWLPGETEE